VEKPTSGANIPLFEVPAELLEVVDEVARARLGAEDAVSDALAAQVSQLSTLYTRDREAIGGDDRSRLVAARLRFFLPRDLPKVVLPLAELAHADALPPGPRWSVLDLGAGLGATSLGVARFARVTASADRLDVVAVDPWERGLSLLSALSERAERAGLCPVSLTQIAGTMEGRLPPGPFDLILLGLSLNEWAKDKSPADGAALLARISERLAPGGALIVIEPALRSEARFLQEIRDALGANPRGPTIFAPCLSSEPCPMLTRPRDWCHANLPGELEAALGAIARAAGLRRSRRTFSYLTLRRDGRNLSDDAASSTFRVVSQGLPSKGKHELFVCGAGALVRLTRLNRHASEANAAFSEADRGDLLRLPEAPDVAKGKARIGSEDEVTIQGIGRATEPPN